MTAMLVMTTVQPVIMAGRDVHDFLRDHDFLGYRRFLGAAGRDGGTRGAADGATNDRAVTAAEGRAHRSAGDAAQGAAEYGFSIDIAGEGGGGEGGQRKE